VKSEGQDCHFNDTVKGWDRKSSEGKQNWHNLRAEYKTYKFDTSLSDKDRALLRRKWLDKYYRTECRKCDGNCIDHETAVTMADNDAKLAAARDPVGLTIRENPRALSQKQKKRMAAAATVDAASAQSMVKESAKKSAEESEEESEGAMARESAQSMAEEEGKTVSGLSAKAREFVPMTQPQAYPQMATFPQQQSQWVLTQDPSGKMYYYNPSNGAWYWA